MAIFTFLFQNGALMVSYAPKSQLDMNDSFDTLLGPYGNEGVPFSGPVTNDPVHAHWLWTGREHVFR